MCVRRRALVVQAGRGRLMCRVWAAACAIGEGRAGQGEGASCGWGVRGRQEHRPPRVGPTSHPALPQRMVLGTAEFVWIEAAL